MIEKEELREIDDEAFNGETKLTNVPKIHSLYLLKELIGEKARKRRALIAENKQKAEQEKQKKKEEAKNLPTDDRLDFGQALKGATSIFKNQIILSSTPGAIDVKELEISSAKASAFLEGIGNILHASHLKELVESDGQKFKRSEELKTLNPLLIGFQKAAIAAEKSVTYLGEELEKALNNYGGVEINPDGAENEEYKRIAWLQIAYKDAIDNLSKISKGVNNTIQLERLSGSRPWGASRTGKGFSIAEELGSDGSGNREEVKGSETTEWDAEAEGISKGLKNPRKITEAEYRAIVKNSTKEQVEQIEPENPDEVITEEEIERLNKETENLKSVAPEQDKSEAEAALNLDISIFTKRDKKAKASEFILDEDKKSLIEEVEGEEEIEFNQEMEDFDFTIPGTSNLMTGLDDERASLVIEGGEIVSEDDL